MDELMTWMWGCVAFVFTASVFLIVVGVPALLLMALIFN